MSKREELRTRNPAEAEALLTAALSSASRLRLQRAFRLSSAALAEEPSEWPAQIVARLQADPHAAAQRVIRSIVESQEGSWLRPVRSPLIPTDGPILQIVDAHIAHDQSRALVWSADRQRVTSFRNSSFRTWDLRANCEASRIDPEISTDVAAIANPPLRAVAAAHTQLLLVNLENGATEVLYSGDQMECVAISANGAWAVTTSVPPDWDYRLHDGDGPRTFRLFDLEQRSCVRTWQAHRAAIRDLAITGDGKYLATASNDKMAELVDLRKGRTLGAWRSWSKVTAVAIARGGHRIAYTSVDGALTVRQQDGAIVKRFPGLGAEPGCLALSRDGRKMVVYSHGGMTTIDLQTAERLGPYVSPQPYLSSLAIDAKARHAITGEMGSQLVVWDLKRLRVSDPVSSWCWGIWASNEKALIHQDGLSIWDLATGERTELLEPGNYSAVASPATVGFGIIRWMTGGGGRIQIGKWSGRHTKPLIKSDDLSRSAFNDVQNSRDGTRLLVPIHRFGCRILDLNNGRTVWERNDMGLGVRPYLSPTGRYVLLCALEGHLEAVDVDTGAAIQQLNLQPILGRVLFAAEEDCVFIQQGSNTVLFNWRTNSSSVMSEGEPSSISEDGRWMVTVSNARKLVLWALPEKRRTATFTLDVPVLRTALSPDGRHLIAGDQNGAVHILHREG